MKTSKSVLLAIATASVFAAAVAIAQDTMQTQTATAATAGTVKCYGINGCKGKSACQTSTNGCSGKNACRSTGILMANSQQDCIAKGGSLTEPTKQVTQSATQPYSQ
jgi:hypothetical protein